MLILSQDGTKIVNFDVASAITMYESKSGYKFDGISGNKIRVVDNNFQICAWFGNKADYYLRIGDYATEERAKEIIREIWQKSGEYLHRKGGQAILRGSIDIPEAFLVLPKIYEMPKE